MELFCFNVSIAKTIFGFRLRVSTSSTPVPKPVEGLTNKNKSYEHITPTI